MKRTFAATLLALLISNVSAFAASESFQFNFPGWQPTSLIFSGSFTGTPESTGAIGLADVSNFSAVLEGFSDGPISFMRSDLFAFEFDPALGPTSLTFILPIEGSVFLCVGTLAFNPRYCDPAGLTPSDATGVFSLVDTPLYTALAPRVTPTTTASAPEIPTWVMLTVGFAFMVGFGRIAAIRRPSPAELGGPLATLRRD